MTSQMNPDRAPGSATEARQSAAMGASGGREDRGTQRASEGAPGSSGGSDAAGTAPIDALYAAVGDRIKSARRARGWNQTRLADAIGLRRSSITNVEAGRQRLAIHQLLAVSQALRVDIGDLLAGPLPDLTADLPDPVVPLRRRLISARNEIDNLVASLADVAPDPLSGLDLVEAEPRYQLAPGCEHCPDGHTPPDHGQPWGVWVGSERDGDGQPRTIHVARSAGAHVAESDAQWVRDRLNGGQA